MDCPGPPSSHLASLCSFPCSRFFPPEPAKVVTSIFPRFRSPRRDSLFNPFPQLFFSTGFCPLTCSVKPVHFSPSRRVDLSILRFHHLTLFDKLVNKASPLLLHCDYEDLFDSDLFALFGFSGYPSRRRFAFLALSLSQKENPSHFFAGGHN